ncbi:hypothetical protein CC80DRAFT_506476 [Byssothecium circinans]|uniref:Uncharacterized protein n=1 Tax=Byssothecium circinans TaxID=147558 RepID=A0A6A5TZU6_9PLEO|nr:hypothetical protein CC80DRAFT_506476 [Byssothecium circinans]
MPPLLSATPSQTLTKHGPHWYLDDPPVISPPNLPPPLPKLTFHKPPLNLDKGAKIAICFSAVLLIAGITGLVYFNRWLKKGRRGRGADTTSVDIRSSTVVRITILVTNHRKVDFSNHP